MDEQRFTLLAYSERMASLAVREHNKGLIILGLLALGIDGWRGDWRDNAVLISLHYDAAKMLGDERMVYLRKLQLCSPGRLPLHCEHSCVAPKATRNWRLWAMSREPMPTGFVTKERGEQDLFAHNQFDIRNGL
ncbi:MAG: hypothetical protein WDN03_08800 [Rhizomicrobium sp.]